MLSRRRRQSTQFRQLAEARALDELAQRRVRAVGRCPECGSRVERDEDWVRIGDDPWHSACAVDADHAEQSTQYATGG